MALSKEEKDARKEERRIKKYNETHKIIDGIIYKICNICNEWFPCNEEYFYKLKNGIDGLHPSCKICGNAKSIKYRADNIVVRRAYDREIFRPKNRKKMNDKDRKWRESNKIHIAEYSKAYYKNNTDKFKAYAETRAHKEHSIKKKEWLSCKNYFDNKCAYCGLLIEEHYIKFNGEIRLGDFHKEHVDHEGSNGLENCVPSCKNCNSQKWIHSIDVWFNDKNPIYNEDRYNKINLWLSEDYKNYII